MSSANNIAGYDNRSIVKDGGNNFVDDGEQGFLNSQTQKGKNGAFNQQQAANAAHPNTATGTGTQSWHQNPDGTYSESNTLNSQLTGAQGSLSGQVQQNAQNGIGNGDAARNQAITGAYNQSVSRLNPQWQQSNEQLSQQLASEGLDPNSQAYRTAMLQQSQSQNDAYSSAMNNAIGQGTSAQQATFGENLAAYNAPLQQLGEMNNLYSPGDTSGLNALNSANGYTAQNNANSGQAIGTGVSTFGTIAGAAASASDGRIKKNVSDLGVEAAPGVPLVTFEYKHNPGKVFGGVIAQDLEKVRPDAVSQGPDGIKRVSDEFKPFFLGAKNK